MTKNCSHDHDHEHHDCSHGHHDKHSCGSNHDTKSSHKTHSSENKGLLVSIFSRVSGKAGKFLRSHRRKIAFGIAATSATVEALATNSAPVFSAPLFVAAAAISHDAGEDVLEDIGKLKESQGLSAGFVGTAVGFGHTLAEGMFSLMASFNEATDMAVSSVMGSQPSHILLMAGGAAVIGTISAGKSAAWKLHAAAMGLLTGAFGTQVAAGEFSPVVGGVMIVGGGYYLYRRFVDGQSCAIHGDGCSGHAHSRDHEQQSVALKQRLTDPHLLKLGGSVATLMVAAHAMAHELVDLSQAIGVSETTIGTTIAAISLAAPEIILTWKAALKKEADLAWGTIVGCSTATVGIVGGGLALSGAPVPEMLDPTTTEGLIHMAAFAGSTAAVLIASHPAISKDGKISKVVGAGFLAAYMTYLASTGKINDNHNDQFQNEIEAYEGVENKKEMSSKYIGYEQPIVLMQ